MLHSRVVALIQAEIAKLMREPAMTARTQPLGMVMKENGTARYAEFARQDIARYNKVIRRLGLQPN
jgi:hypothetical protein